MKHSFIKTKLDLHFSIQKLLHGTLKKKGENPRMGTDIRNYVLDLSVMDKVGLLNGTREEAKNVFLATSLNRFRALSRPIWYAVRSRLQYLLNTEAPTLLGKYKEEGRLQ
ncbi:fumarylacetoacetase [Priestia megaterium]|uniref:hypothetical protein n=1 Tax=Priestia megaterium TaxID=1404 RepID=UPI00279575D9|nr:hypothetical protein [Priestia megaterium]